MTLIDLCTTAKSLPLYSSSQRSHMPSRKHYPRFTSKGTEAQELASSCLACLLLRTNLWPFEPEHQETVCREIHMCGCINLLDDSFGKGMSYSSPVTNGWVPESVHAHHVYVQCPQRPEEVLNPPECELWEVVSLFIWCGFWKMDSRSLQE